MSPNWTCLAFETTTGRIVAELDTVGAPQFTAGVNEPGSLQATIPVAHLAEAERDRVRGLLGHPRISLAWCYGDWVAQAGPMWTHRVAGSNVVVGASGLWKLLAERAILPASYASVTDPSADSTFGPAALGTVAADIVRANLARRGGALPIVFPARLPGEHTRSYRGYELRSVGEALRTITAEEFGPDIEFRPRLRADRIAIEWVMRIGAPYLGGEGAPPAWDYGTGLAEVAVDSDATNQASRTWVRGDGWERGSLIGLHRDDTLTDRGWPLVDHIVTEHTSVRELSTLDRLARSYSALYRRPIELWSARVNVPAGGVSHHQLAPGFTAVFGITDHPWIPAGQYTRRVIGIGAATNPTDLALTIEATPAER
ncbi:MULTISPECIES: hypothetical protein [unclassified Crossiella]|uniref:hypothetical protein n=1 Tax=unclassified Crossiella TaxID=2620835 RepID=UPI001FFF659F|nr:MULTISPECIES: hypothetical protein [unclassified Crossiella]MCK2242314.1 hypothetical protein [Crossiella sp. S99.2]MCK2254655.1 hypothetical protein [Crossiella sp. S99.1]